MDLRLEPSAGQPKESCRAELDGPCRTFSIALKCRGKRTNFPRYAAPGG